MRRGITFELGSCVKVSPVNSVAWAVGGSAAVLSSGFATLFDSLRPSTSIPLFMLVVVIVAWRGGFRASIAVAVAATLGLDFFFTEPRYSLRMSSPQDVFSLIAFAGVSLLISHLSQRIRAQSDDLRRAEREQRALYELSRSVLLLDWKEPVGEQICSLIQERLHLPGVALWEQREGTCVSFGDTAHAIDRLQAAYRADRAYDLPNHAESVRILRFGVRPLGAILLRGDIEPLVADAVATLVATHMERIRAVKAEVSAESQAVSERMRTTVLDGLAHAVKTPLTTIVVSSSGLREIGSLTPLQDELARAIESQASYLSDLTGKLLRTAKLETKDILVHVEGIELTELFHKAIDELRSIYDVERVVVGDTQDRRSVRTDPDLLHMVLVQILENALKYSPASSRVLVRVAYAQDVLTLSVHNELSYIPPKELQLIFERYYRSASMEHRAPGTGIGLSVAKHAVDALGGRIWVESDIENGTTFHIALPLIGEGHAPGISLNR
jgi:two-component system sensor histidine kinase KdpD